MHRLRLSGSIPPLPLYTFMEWRGRTLLLYRHLSLFWARLIQCTQFHPIFINSNLISFQFRPRFSNWSSGFPDETLYAFIFYPTRAKYPTHHILLDLIRRIMLGEYKPWSCSIFSSIESSVISSITTPNALYITPFSNNFKIQILWEIKFNIQTEQQTKLQLWTF